MAGVGEPKPTNRDWSDCDPTFAEEADTAIGALWGPDGYGLATQLVSKYPDSPLAYTILAEWHRVRMDPQMATAHFRSAEALAPRCPQIAYQLAAMLIDMGSWDEAVEVCDRSLLVPEPTDPALHFPYRRNCIVTKSAEHRIAYTREGIRRLRLGAGMGKGTAVPPELPPERAELHRARDLWRGMSEEKRQAFLEVSFEDMKSYCRSEGLLEMLRLLPVVEEFIWACESFKLWACPLCTCSINGSHDDTLISLHDDTQFMLHMENFHIEIKDEEYKKLRSSMPERIPDIEMELLKSWRWEPKPIDGDDLAERTKILSEIKRIVFQLIDMDVISLNLLFIIHKFIMSRVRPVKPLVVSICACCGIGQLSSVHLKELYELLEPLTHTLKGYEHQKYRNGEQESQQDSPVVTIRLKETGTYMSFGCGKIASTKTDGSNQADESLNSLFHESLLDDTLATWVHMRQRCLNLGPDILNTISEALDKLKLKCSLCEELKQIQGDVYFLPDAIFESDIDVKPYFHSGIGSVQVEMLLIDAEVDYQKERLLETCEMDWFPVILHIAKACLLAKLNNNPPQKALLLCPLNGPELEAPLDVILRSLWHLRRFHDTLQKIPCKCPDVKDGDSQIGKKLREIFDSWDNDKEGKPCDPCCSTRFADFTSSLVYKKDAKRRTATEIVKLIFRRLHSSQTPLHFEFKGETLELQTVVEPTLLGCICLTHDLFGLHICENKCNCVNELPTKYEHATFLHSVDLSAVGKTKLESFSELLKATESRIGSCGHKFARYSLLYPPHLFMTVFKWKDIEVSHINMHEVLISLAAELNINHIYGGLHSGCMYTLVSAVCCNDQGQYLCFARNKNRWLIYDNNRVTCAESWEESIQRYSQDNLCPEFLFFELEHVE
ncbi:hypothetical protein E2562_017373 [Oryza meyeriana var. granulata]|uniref:Uncharacterized protein n=1 Tax=Oryza meyeriana var. granulata TaxID=110450 RepID=A0A6G1D4X9_9ORYZ|nr:hypothetical protein E2562_017373 [Oryza meyeriana var. granulata]